MTDLPPAASLRADQPPPIRAEIESGWQDSVQACWARLQSTACPVREDWLALIRAERLNRMSWLEAEEAGKKRGGGRKKSASMLAGLLDSDDGSPAVAAKKPRKSRARGLPASTASPAEESNQCAEE